MTTKGGMTTYYEQTDKRKQFAIELQKQWPEITQVKQRFGRWHHLVDYSGFKHNRPIKVSQMKGGDHGLKMVRPDQ